MDIRYLNSCLSQHPDSLYDHIDIECDIRTDENKNTRRKTETDMRIFISYLASMNELRQPETIPPVELDRHLATYFSIIKKHDGNEYEPASLRGMLCSIERYLRCKNYQNSLTRDIEFLNTRNMLKEKQKILREIAKHEKGTKHNILSLSGVEKLNHLYLAKEFGPHSPSAVINALCFAFVVHLKIRKAIDHKQLLWGDIALKTSHTGEEHLCYEPLSNHEYCRLPLKGISHYKIFSCTQTVAPWDPVAIYKLYRQQRPNSMTLPDNPFYLGIAVSSPDMNPHSWFKPVPMGVNKLNDLVRMIRNITDTISNDTCRTNEIRRTPPDIIYHENKEESEDSEVYYNKQCSSAQTSTKSSENEHDHSSNISTTSNNHDKSSTDPNTSRKMSPTTSLEDAKNRIREIINLLDYINKQHIVKWLNSIGLDEESSELRENSRSGRKHFSVSFEMGSDIESSCPFDVIAKIQALPLNENSSKLSNNDTKNEESEQCSIVQSIKDINVQENHQPSDILNISHIIDPNDMLSPKSRDKNLTCKQNSLKRLMKDHEQHQSFKQQKIHFDHDVQYVGDNRQLCDEHLIENSTDVSGATFSIEQALDTDGQDQEISKIEHHDSQMNSNPMYGPWGMDPRFAMFLRNGFVQTYQDLINMYKAVSDIHK